MINHWRKRKRKVISRDSTRCYFLPRPYITWLTFVIVKWCCIPEWYSDGFLWMGLQVSYMILQRVSPVTHSVGNCVKRVVVIVSSVIFFQTPVSPVNAFGKVASFWFELENIWRILFWNSLNHWISLFTPVADIFILFFYRDCYSSCWSFPLFKGEAY